MESAPKWFDVERKESFIMLYGRYEHTVDAKNRVFIPAKFKEALGNSFKITFNRITNKCILVYSNEEWEKLEKEVVALPRVKHEVFIREVFSNTVDVQLDAQGRIVIPQFLKDNAELQKNVLFLGVGTHIEIWSPDVLEEKNSKVDPEELKNMMMEIGF